MRPRGGRVRVPLSVNAPTGFLALDIDLHYDPTTLRRTVCTGCAPRAGR